MANLIGDLLYPDNPTRRDKLNTLQTEALDIQSDIVRVINSYNSLVRVANDLTSYNVVLRALAETSKNPFKDEELRKPVDVRGRPYTEAMATSILDLAARIGGGAAFGVAFGNAIKAFMNRPIAVAAENLGGELIGMGAARALGGAEGLVPGVAEGLAQGGTRVASGAAEAAGVAARGLKYARALRVLKFSGAAVVLAVGVEVILGWIEGSRERDALEENIKKLADAHDGLDADRKGLKSAKSEAEALIKLALEQFNLLQKELADISHITPVEYRFNTLADAENAVNGQRQLAAVAGSYLQSVQLFRKKWAKLFAEGKEPTREERQEVFADLVTYNLLPNEEEGERRYQLMRRIDAALQTPSPAQTPALAHA